MNTYISTLLLDTLAREGINANKATVYLSECLEKPIHFNTIYNWVNGDSLPRIDTLAALVRAYPLGDWRGDFARNILYAALGEDRRA